MCILVPIMIFDIFETFNSNFALAWEDWPRSRVLQNRSVKDKIRYAYVIINVNNP